MKGYAASLRAFAQVFSNPSVRNVQLADVGSTLGTWAYGVALPLYAFHAGGTRAVGLLFFARFTLAALAAPWLGLLADRWSRRQLMLTADIVRAVIFAAITAVAVTGASPYIAYVLAVTSTMISGAYPPAQAALMPTLVNSPEELTAANVVGNTINSVGIFAGPAIAGILLVFGGPAAAFALNGAFFIWSAIFIAQVPRDERPKPTERQPFLPELTAGFRAVLEKPALRVVVGLTGAATFVAGAMEVLLVVLVLDVLGSTNAGLGWLNTALGVGALLGAFVAAGFVTRRRLAGLFALGVALATGPLALTAAFSSLAPAIVLLGIMGVGSTMSEISSVTLMQRSADNEVMGRVFAVLGSIVLGALAIGSLVAPAIVNWLGSRGALIAFGVLVPVLLLPLWPALRKVDAEAVIAEEPLELLRKIKIFAELPEPVLERLAAGATSVLVAADGVVVERGEVGNHFYAIESGKAGVERDDGTTRELGAGDFFGEIALLRDVPRTATVRALEPLRLFAIERDDFLVAVTGHDPTLAVAENVVTSLLPAGALAG